VARQPTYWPTLRERFGFLPASIPSTKPAGIWLHAVSVGEVLSAVPLTKRLRREFPSTPLFVSTTTLAGRKLANERLMAAVDGIFYLPVDYPFAIRRVLRRIEPVLFLNLETELWPNLIREVKRSGAQWMQLNARISDRAWPRYRRFASFWRNVLPQMDFLAAQSAQDASRFEELGYDKPIHQAGNLKFDFEPAKTNPPQDVLDWIHAGAGKPLWIAASTMPPAKADDPDEDDAVLDAYREMEGEVRLLLAPRRPERFDVAAAKLGARGIPYARRTDLRGRSDVLLLDSIGELAGLFPFADVVFVGGTLVDRGGHNVLEPASFGKPTFVGPNMQNFPEISRLLEEAGGLRRIASAGEIATTVRDLIANPEPLASHALVCARSLRGVTDRLIPHIRRGLGDGVNLERPALQAALRPLALPWRAVSGIRKPVRRLPVPVVSVGNLTVGGTGKTPTVLAIARRLERAGRRVAILTRGYGRSGGGTLVFQPGESAPWQRTGDEAQLYLAESRFAVGIGADRHATGLEVLKHFDANLFLLDDGFQHRGLHRDFDLALVDATRPFGGLEVPPAGWLREPLAGLKRADAVVLTRARGESDYRGLMAYLPSGPPIYRATEKATGPSESWGALAFCGIGNPAGFRQTLDGLGLREVPLEVFPDHHDYADDEIARLRGAARRLITTRKDAVKLAGRLDSEVVEQTLELPEELWEKLEGRLY
jgi:3-deoxy-D-manno-octulosonic-acid transferase